MFEQSENRHRQKYRRKQRSNQRNHGNLRINRRSCGVLKGIADRIADNSGPVRAGFNLLFRIVPKPAGIGHEQRNQQTADDVSAKKTADGVHTADKTGGQRCRNGKKAGRNQLG